MIIKRLFSIEKWQVFKVNQLRMELKSRNLPAYGIKAQLIQRIVDYENNFNNEKADSENPEFPTEIQPIPQETHKIPTKNNKNHLESLTRTTINFDSQSLPIDSNKPLSIETPDPRFQSPLNEQNIIEDIDFKDLIKYLERKYKNITYDDNLWKLIEGFSKIDQISSDNRNLLLSIDRKKLKKFLIRYTLEIEDSCKAVTFLKAVAKIENIDNNFVEKSDEPWLFAMFKTVLKSMNDIDLMDLAFIKSYRPCSIDFPQKYDKIICEFMIEKFRNVSDLNKYSKEELLFILKALPMPTQHK